MNTAKDLPKIGVGDTVTVKYRVGIDYSTFTGTVHDMVPDPYGHPVMIVSDGTDIKAFSLETAFVDSVVLVKKSDDDKFVPSPIDDSVVEALKREVHTPSFYTVSFTLCRDGERIATVSGRKQGKLSPTELIQLAILANYKNLSYFAGSWLSVYPLGKLLEHYVKDGLPLMDSSFGVDGVSVSCYDAEKGKFYDIAVPNHRHLLVENLDAAYNYYICKWEPPREKD
jgi:hypothetical protein